MQNIQHGRWWLVSIRGIAGLLFGLVLLVSPIETIESVILLIGLYLLLDGIVDSISSLASIKHADLWWINLFKGILSLLSGLAILNYPQASIAIVFFLFALWLLLSGILIIVESVATKKEDGIEWSVVTLGTTSLILGVLVINNPYASIKLIILFSGIYAILSGIIHTALGLRLRSESANV